MSDCRFGVSPVNYPDPDPEVYSIFSIINLGNVLALKGDYNQREMYNMARIHIY